MTIIVYLMLYLSYKNGYSERKNEEKRILTELKIKEYEEDLANGVDVTNKEYVVVRPTYDNTYTRASLKLSASIEKIIDKSIKYLFRKLSRMVDE